MRIAALNGAGYVRSLMFDPLGRTLVAGDHLGNVGVWDTARGQLLLSLQPSTNGVNGVAFSRDGNMLAAAAGPRVFLWQREVDWGKVEQTLASEPVAKSVERIRAAVGRELTPAEVREFFGDQDELYVPLWPDGKPPK